jgi:serine protease Do
MGVGFAIPINLARTIADQLIQEGVVTRGYLGVVIQDLSSDLAESFDIEGGKGVVVAQVSADSPAEAAGIEVGDIIVAYNDQPVTEVGSFRNRVSLTKPGERQKLTIIREGQRRDVNVTVGTLSQEQMLAGSAPASSSGLGLAVQTLTPALAQELNVELDQGVVVTQVQPGSPAANAGLQPGVIILQVNKKRVATAEEFKRAIDAIRQGDNILLLARYGDSQRYIVLDKPG